MPRRPALPLLALALLVGCDDRPADPPAAPPAATGPTGPAGAATSRPAVVATWNAGALFSPAEADARSADLADLAADVRPDVPLLDEVNSLETARSVAAALGLPTGPEHVVVSDFNPNDRAGYNSLEVAILSRYPLSDAVEFDRGPEGGARPDHPEERRLERVDRDGIADLLLTAQTPSSKRRHPVKPYPGR